MTWSRRLSRAIRWRTIRLKGREIASWCSLTWFRPRKTAPNMSKTVDFGAVRDEEVDGQEGNGAAA